MRQKIRLFALFFLAASLLASCSAQKTPENPMVGTTASDFTLDNALGGRTSLSDYQGKPVLLYFHMAVG
jgi:cytochrome oxidase Cu insertion factor (SCO1/SenC/PrrC family)